MAQAFQMGPPLLLVYLVQLVLKQCGLCGGKLVKEKYSDSAENQEELKTPLNEKENVDKELKEILSET